MLTLFLRKIWISCNYQYRLDFDIFVNLDWKYTNTNHYLKFNLKLIFSLFVFLFYQEYGLAQQKYYSKIVQDTILINFANKYEISQTNIVPFTETIQLRNRILTNTDYNFAYERASFSLSDSLQYSIFDTLIVTYQAIKIPISKEYKRRTLLVRYDEQRRDTIRVPQSVLSSFSSESIFGSEHRKKRNISTRFYSRHNKRFHAQQRFAFAACR